MSNSSHTADERTAMLPLTEICGVVYSLIATDDGQVTNRSSAMNVPDPPPRLHDTSEPPSGPKNAWRLVGTAVYSKCGNIFSPHILGRTLCTTLNDMLLNRLLTIFTLTMRTFCGRDATNQCVFQVDGVDGNRISN